MAENNQPKTISWTASEFIDHSRGANWYLMLALSTAAIAGVTYLLTKEWITTTTIIILGILVAFATRLKPRQIEYEITATSFRVGDRSYNFNEFKFFSIIHERELSSINLYPTKRFMPIVTAFFDEADGMEIMELLGKHLPMTEASPDRFDRLSRQLRL